MHQTRWLLAGIACGLVLNAAAAARAANYAETHAEVAIACNDALDQTTINRCLGEQADRLQRYEREVLKAARRSVLKENADFYTPSQRTDFARKFDRAADAWRAAVDDECDAEGVAENGTAAGQTISSCIIDRTDHHIRALIEEYRLEHEFGPVPAPER